MALAFLSPSAARTSGSMLDAAASVCPAVLSTSWTAMCRDERLTTRRGRPGEPLTRLRSRKCRRALASRRRVELSLPTTDGRAVELITDGRSVELTADGLPA